MSNELLSKTTMMKIGRETVGLDFLLTRMKAEKQNLKEVCERIAAVPSDDGFAFSFADIELLSQPHMHYPGLRKNWKRCFRRGEKQPHEGLSYHDLLLLVRGRDLINLKKLKKAASTTFANRETPPALIQFDNTGFETLQRLWTAHLRGLGDIAEELKLPKDIKTAVDEINSVAASLLG